MRGRERGLYGSVRPVMVGVALVLALVLLLCVASVRRLQTMMEEDVAQHLNETAGQVAAAVRFRVEANFQALETAAANWNRVEDLETGFQRMDTLAHQYGFQRIGVVDLEGNVRTTDGYRGNLSGLEEVQDALAGRARISGVLSAPEDGRPCILYAVPILSGEGVKGAMTAAAALDKMRATLEGDSFGGEGYFQIVDGAGDFVVASSHKNAPALGAVNFFRMVEERDAQAAEALAEMRARMARGGSGLLNYTMDDGVARTACYVQLGVEDWYLLSVVPTEAAQAGASRVIRQATAVNLALAGLFLALTLLILWLDRRNRRELQETALVDQVTGGMNRLWFEREAGRRVKSAPSGTYMVAELDIRRFKLINDAFGSREGDRTLRYVHDTLLRHMGEGELCGRTGGDVFSLLLRRRSRKEMLSWLEETAGDINAFNDSMERKYFLSFAVGVYEVDDRDLDMITLQDRANVARKKSGEGKAGHLVSCIFYSDVERLRMLREKEIDDRKELALSRGEFVVYLQPKVDLDTRRVAGAEALVRWRDPDYGLVPPDQFIPAFERNGFITQVDLYVFEEVCRLLRSWIDRGLGTVPISVNLSRVHLREPGFLRRFQAVVERYRVPPALLEFEFTETVAVENPEGLIAVTRELHSLGFGCALDDFGSGYSSLNILKDVPVDVLKLDRAFFDGAGVGDQRGRFVVENVVALARKLDMRTVSEGVETMDQVDFLHRAGCDMVQGFVFSKPVPPEQFERMAFDGAAGVGADEKEVGV